MIVIDAQERPVSVSRGLRRALGLGEDEPTPHTLRGLMDGGSARRVHAAFEVGEQAEPVSLALRLVASDGSTRDVAARLLQTAGGGAVLMVSFDPDAWSRDDASRLVDHSRDLVLSMEVRPAFSFRYANSAATRITGYSSVDLRKDPAIFLDAIHSDDRPLFLAALSDRVRLEDPVVFRYRRRDGECRWFELSGAPVLDQEGSVAIVDCIIRDVTVRHRLEERFRLLAERSPDMIYRLRIEPDTATEYMSPACQAVTGHPQAEFLADPLLLMRYVHPDDRSLLQECADSPGDHCHRTIRFRVFHPDGSLHWLEQVIVPVRDEQDRLVAVEGICRDITLQQEVDASLQAMNARMNLLASLTRHDILNQLTVLLGSLELAGSSESGAELAWFLNRSREAAWAIQRLTEFTRDFQEIGQGAPGWIPVTLLARRAAASFVGDTVFIEIQEAAWEIRTDPLIEQVFYNLIENALRHGGRTERIRFSVVEQPDGGILIVCEDDGDGVPLNEKERIFMRGHGRNTGLGLYLAAEVLATTGMSIAETGQPGIGARFEIRVPSHACRLAVVPRMETSSRRSRLAPRP